MCAQLYWQCIAVNYKVSLMNWQEFTALLALATAMSFSPGPNTTLSAALAANHGLRRTLRFVCAVPVGWGLLLTLCVFGLGALLLALPLLATAVKAVGVGYLIYLAAKLFNRGQIPIHSPTNSMNAGNAINDSTIAPPDPGKLDISFTKGVALQFVNIKAWMLALAIVSGWIAGRANLWERFAVVLPVMLVFAFVSNLTYALIGALLKDWLAGPHQSGRRLLVFNRAMALVLLVTAWWMATA